MKKKNILLVEDNFLNRRISKKILEENNYVVLEAKNASETLRILQTEHVDLIILDINLGENEQSGISLAQQIRRQYTVPFIYLTAYENGDVISKALATSPHSYLTKPFKSVDLITSAEIAMRQPLYQQKYEEKIVVKDEDYQVEISLSAINYIESEGNYVLLHTDEKVYRSRATIKQIQETLPSNLFMQVHRGYLVNKTKIEKYNNKGLVVNKVVIPISKNYFNGNM